MAKSKSSKTSTKKSITSKTNKQPWPVFEKPGEEVVNQFNVAIPDDERIERRKMFGFPCIFVNGNMAAGIFNQSIFARMNKQDLNDWLNNKKATLFEPMPGRPMKEYIDVPNIIVQNPVALKEVLQQSVDYTLSMKPKEKKKK
jgi:TfoX/Sxy family transcriptional regulator of competence genes